MRTDPCTPTSLFAAEPELRQSFLQTVQAKLLCSCFSLSLRNTSKEMVSTVGTPIC